MQNLEKFGGSVLDYFLESSEENQIVVFAIDDVIFKELLDKCEIKESVFNDSIKNYIQNHKLNFRNNPNVALALAAHQVKLAYDAKDDDIDNRKVKIRAKFEECYGIKEKDLDNYYFGNNDNIETLQDKLWEEIVTIFGQNGNREIKIPKSRTGAYRYLQYPLTQLLIKNKIESYFQTIFKYAGIGKNVEYTQSEFRQIITNAAAAPKIHDICNEICEELKNRTDDQEYYKSFATPTSLLCNILWNNYQKWDGNYLEDELFQKFDNDTNSDFIDDYIQLYDDDNTFSFHGQTFEDKSIFNNKYFRCFSNLYGYYWKLEEENYPIPVKGAFVLLVDIEKCPDVENISRVNCIEYKNNKNPNMVCLRFLSKPNDKIFDDIFPAVEKSKITLKGGIKIERRDYLSVPELSTLLPQRIIDEGLSVDEPITFDSNDIKTITIKNKNSGKKEISYRLFEYKENGEIYDSNWSKFYGKKLAELPNTLIKKSYDYGSYIDPEIFDFYFWAKIENGKIVKKRDSNGRYIRNDQGKIQYDIEYLRNFLDNKKLSFQTEPISAEKLACDIVYNNLLYTELKIPFFENNQNLQNITEIVFKLVNPQKKISDNFHFTVDVLHYRIENALVQWRESKNHPKINSTPTQEETAPKKLNVVDFGKVNASFEDDLSSEFKNELFDYQDALYHWLGYKSFATWEEIHKLCAVMIETSKFPNMYSINSEYQIFYPLLRIGLIDSCLKVNDKSIFCLSNKIQNCFLPKNDFAIESRSYRKHFCGENPLGVINCVPSLPKLSVIIKNMKKDANQTKGGYVKYQVKHPQKFRWYKYTKYEKALNSIAPCLFKYEDKPWKSYSFILSPKEKWFLPKEFPDAMNVCKSYILAQRLKNDPKEEKLFTYNKETKQLLCHDFLGLPTYYARALIMLNPEILKKDDLYISGCKDYREQIFEGIELQSVEELNRLYN